MGTKLSQALYSKVRRRFLLTRSGGKKKRAPVCTLSEAPGVVGSVPPTAFNFRANHESRNLAIRPLPRGEEGRIRTAIVGWGTESSIRRTTKGLAY